MRLLPAIDPGAAARPPEAARRLLRRDRAPRAAEPRRARDGARAGRHAARPRCRRRRSRHLDGAAAPGRAARAGALGRRRRRAPGSPGRATHPARAASRRRSSAARSRSSRTSPARRTRRGSTARSCSSRTWARSRTGSTATSRSSALAGALDGVAGVAVGPAHAAATTPGVRGADVVRELVARARRARPSRALPVGHEDANFALPLGARATLVAPGRGRGGRAAAPVRRVDRGGERRRDAGRSRAVAGVLEAGRRDGRRAGALRGGAARRRGSSTRAATASSPAPGAARRSGATISSTSPRSRR